MFKIDKSQRAIALAVQTSGIRDDQFARSLAELHQLARTLGVDVVGTITQKRTSFDSVAYLGKGKREELKRLIGSSENPECDTLLVEHELSPSQAHNLEEETGCVVLDRTQIILEIFSHHARSRAARTQIEIVRLQYMAPRLRESSTGKDRQRGGIGGKGAGESAIELDRRKIRDRVAELTVELAALEEEKRVQRARRSERAGLIRVALVGYTNAGKSTWMRALTGSEVYVADKLFATLDTTVRALQPESVPRIVVSDTVGFIRNLPHGLVASFKSTLDEAIEASLLLHVVDAADPGFPQHMQVTDTVLDEIGAHDVPRLVVFNKIDLVADEAATRRMLFERWPLAKVVSAHRPEDVSKLRETLVDHFSRDLVEGELRVGWDNQRMRGEIYSSCQVVGERASADAAFFRVRTSPEVLARLKGLLA